MIEMMKFYRREQVKIIYIELSKEEAMKRNLLRGRADDTNCHLLYEYVSWFYGNVSDNCWGSPERYNQWIKKEK